MSFHATVDCCDCSGRPHQQQKSSASKNISVHKTDGEGVTFGLLRNFCHLVLFKYKIAFCVVRVISNFSLFAVWVRPLHVWLTIFIFSKGNIFKTVNCKNNYKGVLNGFHSEKPRNNGKKLCFEDKIIVVLPIRLASRHLKSWTFCVILKFVWELNYPKITDLIVN